MAEYKLLMPKMGESVIEATILTWHKQVGDVINEQDVILEVATDKVDTEVPSSVAGVLKQILHEKDAVVPVGDVLAIIEVGGDASSSTEKPIVDEKKEAIVETKVEVPESKLESKEEIKIIEKPVEQVVQEPIKEIEKTVEVAKQIVLPTQITASHLNRYYSPLVLNIAQVENISMQELENITGNGVDNRVTKEDILSFVELKKKGLVAQQPIVQNIPKKEEVKVAPVQVDTQKTETNKSVLNILIRVLFTWVQLYFKEVGYIQGMNILCSILLYHNHNIS